MSRRWLLAIAAVSALALLVGFLVYRGSRSDRGGESRAGRPSAAKLAPVPDVSSVQGELLVYFLDVTLGDAIFIRLPSGEDLVIDGGDSPDELSTFLDFLGEKSIDVLIASHPHEDHISGLARVIRERQVKQV